MTQIVTLSMSLLMAGALTAQARAAEPTSFVADAAASRLEFLGVQAGAEFRGTFHKFTSSVELAPDAPGTAHIDVQIELSSLDTKDADRDKTMRSPDIFDVARFPTAHYETHSVTRTATGYAASGALTLRGVTKDVPIAFKFTRTGSGATLDGTASLKRLDFGVGQGDWKNTEWIADPVKVSFSLALKPRA